MNEGSRQDGERGPMRASDDVLPISSIAIVGMALRIPGASGVDEFWRNLRDGVESITHFDAAELEDSFSDEVRGASNFVRARPMLEGVDLFDAQFFGMQAREAELTDPQQRMFLECASEALEDAGCDPSRYPGAIGVFAGCSTNTYLLHHVLQNRSAVEEFTSNYQVGGYQTLVGALQDFLATRVSYKLDLKGPSMTVQSGCSTSLLAVAQACQSLLLHQSDAALVGGVSITFPQKRGYLHQDGGMVSVDGHCRSFDAKASGTIFGSGCAVVMLKRLEDALAQGDRIVAVIRGYGVNNDGAAKVGFTAPSARGQAAAIEMALSAADVDAQSIGYVECHGTATPLGDPIEVQGLTQAFGCGTPGSPSCAIGSVKSNVGHLDAAAGVVGLIKTALMLQHAQLVPSLHYQAPNPQIDFAASPFYVNTQFKPWLQGKGPRRAGVSAFGVGGTNVHVVMEEAPRSTVLEPASHDPFTPTAQLLVLSARTETALHAMRVNLAAHLRSDPELDLAGLAYSLQTTRRAFVHRLTVVCHDVADAIAKLEAGSCHIGVAQPGVLPVFMFPGQGSQYPEMGLALYQCEPAFRAAMDRCVDILWPLLGFDLLEVLHPAGHVEGSAARLKTTAIAQPAIFAVEYAMAQLWLSWGLKPRAMVGHSLGEFVAATLAGVMSLEDALALVCERARLMQEQPGGAMLAVCLAEAELLPLLATAGPSLSIAAINTSALCVVSGSYAGIDELEQLLTRRSLMSSRLHTSHAFHSAMVDPVIEPFRQRLSGVRLRAPSIPYASCVTGQWVRPEEAMSADYWAQHARLPVRFADAITTVIKGGATLLLEVGPGQALASFARNAADRGQIQAYSSLPRRATEVVEPAQAGTTITAAAHSDRAGLLDTLGRLWIAGVEPDWVALHGGVRRKLRLPTYPFERRRHWIEAPTPIRAGAAVPRPEATTELVAVAQDSAVNSPGMAAPVAMPTSLGSNDVRLALAKIFEELSGEDRASRQPSASFLELGFDSLFLSQIAQTVQTRLGVKISFRQLFGELSSLDTLAAHVANANSPLAAALPIAALSSLKGSRAPLERQTSTAQSVGAPQLDFHEPVGDRLSASPPMGSILPTESQHEIWLAVQMSDAASCAFNESVTLHFKGVLEAPLLLQALNALVARHDALRISFSPTGELMHVATALQLNCPILDLSALSETGAAEAYARLIAKDGGTPFDLEHGPLVRAQLICRDELTHQLVLTLHHIICDGWSLNIVAREIAVLYDALLHKTEPVLPRAQSFISYAEALRHGPHEDAARTEAYWLHRFECPPASLNLPNDQPRPAVRSFNGASRTWMLDSALAQAIRAAGARQGCTLLVTLLGAFQVLMGRLAGQDEVVVGVPMAGQSLLGEQNLVGHCVNFLPIRGGWSRSTSLSEFLVSAQQTMLDARDHQRYTLGTLVQRLKLPHDASRTPLTQLQFNLERISPQLQTETLSIEVTTNPKAMVNFELTINVIESDQGLRLDCNYNRDLFDAVTVDLWLEFYETLLRALVAEAGQTVVQLRYLPSWMHESLLVERNRSDAPYPHELGVHQLIEQQAAIRPDAIAARHAGKSMSYSELNRCADQLAHQLLARIGDAGHGEPRLVGLLMERSLDLLVAMLATLKAGLAYVPLDPSYPVGRLRHVIADAQLLAIISDAAAADNLVSIGVPIIDPRRDAAQIAVAPPGHLVAFHSSDSLAYVIYTSGSTGLPKGVQITHRALVNLLTSMALKPGLSERDVVLAITTISFDIAALELLLPLVVGGCVEIAAGDECGDGLRLLDKLRSCGATMLQATPSGWRLLLEAGFIAPPGFKMLCGGEALTQDLAGRLLAGAGELWNMYGPTETTVWSACTHITADDTVIGIGAPIANTQLYLLDHYDELVPIGVPGELHIAGDGLARGYHRRCDLSAEKFVANRFGPGRLYRTGDLARWLPGGHLQMLGRVDHQIKLRGFRIEPGEIAAAMVARAGVAEATVILREDVPNQKRLVAYYIEAPDCPRTPAQLRAALAPELPEYMIPAAWVRLDAFPLLANGKMDRSALPAADKPQTASRMIVAPRNSTEARLLAIWCEVLRTETLCVTDDLFDLGVDSIQIFQIAVRARRAGLPLTAKQLFRQRTIQGAAQELQRQQAAATMANDEVPHGAEALSA